MVFLKAIVLVGGYATRLFPISLRTPKALLPVAGEPILSIIIGKLAAAGVTDIIVSLATSQKLIEKTIGPKAAGAKIHYCYEESRHEGEKPGAIGAISQVVEKFGAGDYVIIGGDNFFEGLDLRAVMEFQKEKAAPAVIVFHELADKSLVTQYGVAALDKNGRITKFQEKPKVEEAVSTLASTAVYVASKEFTGKRLPEFIHHKRKAGEKADRLGDLWHFFLDKIPLLGFTYKGTWGDLNTCGSYIELNKVVMNLKAAKRTQGKVDPSATIRAPVIIEKGATVGKDAVIGPYAHLMAGAKIGEGAVVEGSIIFDGAQIGANAAVKDSLVDGNAVVGEGTRVDGHSMLGYGSKLGKNARVLADSAVWPFVETGDDAVIEGKIDVPDELFRDRLAKARFWAKN